MIKLLILLTTIVSLSISTNSQASDLNDKDCAHLQSMLTAMTQEYEKSNNANLSYHFDGAIECERAETHYAITLPHLNINTPNSTTKVGIILINARPAKQENTWNLAFSLPSPIITTNRQDKALSTLSFKKQKNYAVWNEKENILLKLDSQMQDIELKDQQTGITIQLSSLQAQNNFKQQNGLYSGITQLIISDIQKRDQKNASILSKIGEVKITAKPVNWNPSSLKEFSNHMALQHETQNEKPPKLPYELLLAAFEDYKIEISARDITHYNRLSAQTTQQGEPVDVKTLHMDKGHLSFEINDLKSETSDLTLSLGTANLNLPLLSNYTNYLPTNLKIDWSLKNLPLKELLKLAEENREQQGITEGFTKINTLAKLPQILSKAGSQLTIDQNTISTTDYSLNIDGQLKADETAKHKINGSIKTSMSGMDSLIEEIETTLKNNPGNEDKKQLQQLLLNLNLIKGFAKSEQNAQGETEYIYNFSIQPDGKIMINNMDVSMLQMLLRAGQKQ